MSQFPPATEVIEGEVHIRGEYIKMLDIARKDGVISSDEFSEGISYLLEDDAPSMFQLVLNGHDRWKRIITRAMENPGPDGYILPVAIYNATKEETNG